MSQRSKKKRAEARHAQFEHRDLHIEELTGALDRAKDVLGSEDHQKLAAAVDTLAVLTQEIEAEGATIRKLRALLFGVATEEGKQAAEGDASGAPEIATNNTESEATASTDGSGDTEPSDNDESEGPKRPKRKGHGRNGNEKYHGATRVKVSHPVLQHGDRCPECERGKVYHQAKPRVLVRIKAMAPVQATVWELERLRCGLCGDVYTAPEPEGVGEEKYDETARAMVAVLHYGSGVPFYRLEKLQGTLGIPLPAGTQWELVAEAEGLGIADAHKELVRQAADGDVIHHDDTGMKVLALAEQIHKEIETGTSERTGMFTSGIVSTRENRRIPLYYTGRKHAGERLVDLLAQRSAQRGPPIQMCDASSRNTPSELKTILANCNAHARRRFGDVRDNFPQECEYVLEVFHQVYKRDAEAREQNMSPEQRLRHHQIHSGGLMGRLRKWVRKQLHDRKVEPNSGLGEAIEYMLDHWRALTLFLRVAGAPLDNNICERALKKAICHRKNSLFYKTENGARVGDTFMSLIHTCELNGANPFDYLVELQRHHEEVSKDPAKWMPWNYRETLAAGGASPVVSADSADSDSSKL